MTRLIAGGLSTFVIDDSDQISACGFNGCGQLGLRANENHFRITAVKNFAANLSDKKCKDVAVSSFHAIALTSSGKLLGSGFNNYGQLGLGNVRNCHHFTLLPSEKKFSCVAVGNGHTVALTDDYQLFACGDHRSGQLGLGPALSAQHLTLTLAPLPAAVVGKPIIALVAGAAHTVFLTNDGQLWGCGNNEFGQLGLGNYSNQFIFQPVDLQGLGLNQHEKIIKIAAGWGHTVFLTNQGRIYSCGRNHLGQLGVGNYDNQAIFKPVTCPLINDIKAGEEHTVALTTEGEAWGCGSNRNGQLGRGFYCAASNVVIPIMNAASLGHQKIIALAAGKEHTVVIVDSNRYLQGFGANTCGELGKGHNRPCPTFILQEFPAVA